MIPGAAPAAELPLCSVLSIQHDWHRALTDGEKCWVSFNVPGRPQVFGNLSKNVSESGNIFSSPEGFNSELVNVRTQDSGFFLTDSFQPYILNTSFSPALRQVSFVRPIASFENLHPMGAIEAIDISPGGEMGLSGGPDGSLRVWNSTRGTLLRDLVGHFGDVSVARFLPSGSVAISGASDFRIRIWRIADGLCAVTLPNTKKAAPGPGQAHRGGITSIDFIDRGRNFVSGSRDGSVLLWDCASQSCICPIVDFGVADCINDVVVGHRPSLAGGRGHPLDAASAPESTALSPLEFHTRNSVAFYCTASSTLGAHDVGSRSSVFSRTMPSADSLNRIRLQGPFGLLCASKKGRLSLFDIRNVTSGAVWSAFVAGPEVSLLNIAQFGPSSVLVSAQDGQVLVVDTQQGRVRVTQSLTGVDYQPVYGLKVHAASRFAYACGRDGIVRKYALRLPRPPLGVAGERLGPSAGDDEDDDDGTSMLEDVGDV